MILVQLVILILSIVLLFAVSILGAKPKWRWVSTGMLVLTAGIISWFAYDTIGIPRPMQYDVFRSGKFVADIVTVESGYITKANIFLYVEDDNQRTLALSYPNTPELLKRLEEAMNKAQGFGFKMTLPGRSKARGDDATGTDMDYGVEAQPTFSSGAFQKDTNETKPSQDDPDISIVPVK